MAYSQTRLARDKRSSLFFSIINDEEQRFYNFGTCQNLKIKLKNEN